MDSLYTQALPPWMEDVGSDGDIVLSSRVRLARNLSGYPFPNRAKPEQLEEIVRGVRSSIPDLDAGTQHTYTMLELSRLSEQERQILMEKHLTSPNHIQEPEHRALLIREDTAVSIMIHEEDHFRIQCLTAGLNPQRTWDLADQIDNELEKKQNFAFNEDLGYLTACPTNLGTGLRASVMLHLPALVLLQQMGRIVTAATQLGMAVRGFYGEGTDAAGNVFQISNQQTLGYQEQEIIDNVKSVAKQIVDQERASRRMLVRDSGEELADRVWRAYGLLRYARSVSGQEALSMMSEVRLGIDLGIINILPAKAFNELLVMTRPSYLDKLAGMDCMEDTKRDRFRAAVIRGKLKGGVIDVQ